MKLLFFLLGVASLLAVASCRKDDVVVCTPTPVPLPTPTSNLSLEDFTRRNGAPVQTFTLTLGTSVAPQTVITSAGAKLTFPATNFVLPTGALATGTAQVRVQEIYSVPDMVLSNMPTLLAGSREVLISGGEFRIQAWQNGVRLQLAPGTARVAVQSPVPTGASSGRQLLWQQPATRLLGDSAGWIPATPPPVSPGQPTPRDTIRTIGQPLTYLTPIPLDSISWWNIDQLWHLYQAAPVGTVTVQVPAIPAGSTGSTRVFLRVVGLNGLARLYPTTPAQTAWVGQLPSGASMVAAVLQSIGGQLYFGAQALNTQPSLVITPTLTAVSEAEAIRLIKQL